MCRPSTLSSCGAIRIVPPSHQESVPISHPFELSSHQDCASETSRECADQPPFRAFETPRLCVNEPSGPSFGAIKLRAFRAIRNQQKSSCVLSTNPAAYFQHLPCAAVSVLRANESSGFELRACDMGTVGQPSYQHSNLPVQSKNSCVLSVNSAAYFQKNQGIVQRLVVVIEPSRLELRLSKHQASSHSRNSSFIL
jgi:hypothetical protein